MIVHMNALVVGALEDYVAAPLIGDDAVVRQASHDIQHLFIKKEFRRKARRLKGHRNEMTMRTAIRFASMAFEVIQETGPKCVSACLDQRPRKMVFENAISVISNVSDLV